VYIFAPVDGTPRKMRRQDMTVRLEHRTSGFALCTAITCLITTVASADSKNYPGSGCAPDDGNPSTFIRYAGGLWNADGTNELGVSCPIVRDNTTNTNGLNTSIVWVYNTGGTLSCTVSSISEYGQVKSYNTQSTTAVGNVKLVFPPLLSSTNTGGTYTIWCSLPKSVGYTYARIYAYQINEY
jgi:hypothetical protein